MTRAGTAGSFLLHSGPPTFVAHGWGSPYRTWQPTQEVPGELLGVWRDRAHPPRNGGWAAGPQRPVPASGHQARDAPSRRCQGASRAQAPRGGSACTEAAAVKRHRPRRGGRRAPGPPSRAFLSCLLCPQCCGLVTFVPLVGKACGAWEGVVRPEPPSLQPRLCPHPALPGCPPVPLLTGALPAPLRRPQDAHLPVLSPGRAGRL